MLRVPVSMRVIGLDAEPHQFIFKAERDDFEEQMARLVEVLARNYIERSKSAKRLDRQRESDHNWFLSQEWAGMALYANSFAGDLKGVTGVPSLSAAMNCIISRR